MLSATFNITIGSLVKDRSYSSYSSYSHRFPAVPARHRFSHTAGLIRSLLGPLPRVFTYIITKPRYMSRYFAKSRQRVKSDKPIKLRTLDNMTWRHDKPTALAIFSLELQLERYGRPLAYDLLMLIALNLHYTDIVNLSLASKDLRQAVFPSPILATRSEELRIQSCENGSKAQCWICTSQICSVRWMSLITDR